MRPRASKVTTMSVTERPSYTKSSFQIPAPSENALLAVIAAAFLVLHIAAGVILINAPTIAAATVQDEATVAPYD
jgi:hypothetical protein